MDPRESSATGAPTAPRDSQHAQQAARAADHAAEIAAAGHAIEASLEAIAGQSRALFTLAGRELGLGAALLARALLLSLIGLIAGLLALGLGAGFLISLGLAFGLGWPGTLAAATAVMLGIALLCRSWASKLLSEARLPATRRQLGALLRGRSAGPSSASSVQEQPA